jgi:uncharacterized membrane protein
MVIPTVNEGPVTKANIGRLTNTIFVFTLFLLFRNIATPTYADWVGNITADKYGFLQAGEIFSFINAFLIVLVVWIITFHVFHQYAWLDRKFLYLHFALLMFVIFIPVTNQHARLFGDNPVVANIFHLNMLALGITIALEWLHCIRNPGVCQAGVLENNRFATHACVLFIPLTAILGFVLVLAGLPDTQYVYFITLPALLVAWTGMNEHIRRLLAVKLK